MYIKFLFLCLTTMAFASTISANCPGAFDVKGAYKHGRKSPIRIETLKAIPANTSTPVIITNDVFSLETLKNSGNGVEAYANPATNSSYITGGVLCNKIYKFYKVRILFTTNVFKSCGATVDGIGTPVETAAIYYNVEYKSFPEALQHSDGIAVVAYAVTVGVIPNPFFTPLQYLLSLGVIKKPGSEFKLPAPLIYLWYNPSPYHLEYYSYLGTYLSLETGKLYPSAIIIALAPPGAFISFGQFAAFRNVLGVDGQPLSATQPSYPQGKKVLLKGLGVVRKPNFAPSM